MGEETNVIPLHKKLTKFEEMAEQISSTPEKLSLMLKQIDTMSQALLMSAPDNKRGTVLGSTASTVLSARRLGLTLEDVMLVTALAWDGVAEWVANKETDE